MVKTVSQIIEAVINAQQIKNPIVPLVKPKFEIIAAIIPIILIPTEMILLTKNLVLMLSAIL